MVALAAAAAAAAADDDDDNKFESINAHIQWEHDRQLRGPSLSARIAARSIGFEPSGFERSE